MRRRGREAAGVERDRSQIAQMIRTRGARCSTHAASRNPFSWSARKLLPAGSCKVELLFVANVQCAGDCAGLRATPVGKPD